MNKEDFELAKQMRAEKLIDFGRLKMREPTSKLKTYDSNFPYTTHWVRFSEKAWTLAHKFRRERAQKWMDREIQKDPTYIKEDA